MTSPFTITQAAPLALAAGQQGQFSFVVASLAAPDKVHEVTFHALVLGDDGKGSEVDWLVPSPRTARIAGGAGQTVIITASPANNSPRGKHEIKLAVRDKDPPHDSYGESEPAACEVTAVEEVAPPPTPAPPEPTKPAPPAPPPTRPLEVGVPPSRPSSRLPRWLIPLIAGGVLLGVGGGVVAWWLFGRPAEKPAKPLALGEPCGGDAVGECGKGLVCAPRAEGRHECLLAGGASCKSSQPEQCASAECDAKKHVCALPIGAACNPGDDAAAPCRKPSICDHTTKTCESSSGGPTCKPGTVQCTADGTGTRSCGPDGAWRTRACPATASLCHDGRCQCSPNKGKPCNCGGTVQCNGSCSTHACATICTNGRCCVFATDPSCGAQPLPTRRTAFNGYILKAIDQLYAKYGRLGYGVGSTFTHNLDYKTAEEIRATNAPKTMCVAAVSEVIIVALKLYADEQRDRSVFDKLPASSWVHGKPTDIRPYMFLYDTVDSNGTADALQHFGLGEHMPFPGLVPGDFIGLNRDNRSGHAVVFLGFLNASGQIEDRYDSKKVVGFKYFSSQGGDAPVGGLGYRWAFFGPCPSWHEADKPRDCGIVLSDDQRVLNTGYMLHPSQWNVEPAMKTMMAMLTEKHGIRLLSKDFNRTATIHDLKQLSLRKRRELDVRVNRELNVELPPTSRLHFDGKTTDD